MSFIPATKRDFLESNIFLVPTYILAGIVIGWFALKSPVGGAIFLVGLGAFVLIEKKFETGLLLLAFFLPFQRLFALEVAGYTVRVSQILTVILLIFWIRNQLKKKELKLARAPLNAPLAFFLLVNFVSMINAINVNRALAIFSWAALCMLLYFLLVNAIRDKHLLTRIIGALLISGTAVSLFGIYQFIGSYLGLPTFLRDVYLPSGMYLTRVQSTALEPLHFASYLLVVIPIVVSVYLMKPPIFSHRLVFASLIIMGIAMVMTIARGGYIGLAIALLVIFLLSRSGQRKSGSFRKIFLALAAGIISLAVIIILLVPRGMIFTTIIGGTAIRAGSSFTRISLINDALDMFNQSPLLGVGIGNFGPFYNKTFKIKSSSVADFRTVNNVPVEILAETGIIGFIALIWIVLSYLKAIWSALRRTNDPFLLALATGFAGSFFGLSFQYLTYSPFYADWTWFMLGLSMVVVRLVKEEAV